MIEKKKNLLLSFDDKMLLQSRKILFKNNLTPQQFITYIFHQMNMGNDEVMELLEKASQAVIQEVNTLSAPLLQLSKDFEVAPAPPPTIAMLLFTLI
jgi:hypothetical protein